MIRWLVTCLVLVALPLAARAQDEPVLAQRGEDVAALIRGEMAYGQVFAPAFVNAVPAAQFDALAETQP